MHGRHDDEHFSGAEGDHFHLPRHGHNRRQDSKVAQWQTPHVKGHANVLGENPEADVDLIELAFIRGLAAATDPTSFLRVAQIPFDARTSDGTRLVLLRVETVTMTDMGSLTPHLGGVSFRYDPLPERMATRRERLRFVYFDGKEPRVLTLALVRQLRPIQPEVVLAATSRPAIAGDVSDR
jgi:hypothetical protein